MNPQLRIEVEVMISKIEELYGSYGEFLEIVSKDDNHRLRMQNNNSKNSLVIFIIAKTGETLIREIQNEVFEGKSDILVISYLDFDGRNLGTRFLPSIEGNFNYSLHNYSAIMWNDNRIRNSSKSGLYLLKVVQNKTNETLIFTPQIHPGVISFEEVLIDKKVKVERYIPGVLSTTLFVRFERKLRPFWNLLPVSIRRILKRLSRYV